MNDIPTIKVETDGVETYNNRITTSKEALIEEVLTLLGYPLITVELTEKHFDVCIKNSLQIYTKYATFQDRYLSIDLKDYTDENGLDLKPLNISVIKDIDCIPPLYFGMSTSELAFGMSGMISQQMTWKNFGFVSLQLLHEFKELAERMLYPKIDWTFNNITGKLLLYPNPNKMFGHQHHKYMVSGNPLNKNPEIPAVITCEIEPPLEELYSNDAVKRLVLGYAKMMLGTIRSKFTNINLPGGAQLTGEALRIEGQAIIDAAVDEIKKTEAFGNIFVIV